MEAKEETSIDGVTRYRKFGLPNWMVNNIERLNFATDFEQYACSPPETESFLTESIDSCDFHLSPSTDAQENNLLLKESSDNSSKLADSLILNKLPGDKPKTASDVKGVSESKSAPNLLAKATEKVAALSIIESMKQEEFYSSPDTTPCATPEPSPLTRRRLSGQQDSVQTNPGRWFYLGNFQKPDPNAKGKNLNVINKVNKAKQMDKASDSSNKAIKSPVKQKKDGLKLVISNFDINAISPSSW